MPFAARIIQPSLAGLCANKFAEYPETFRKIQNDPRIDEYYAAVDAQFQISEVHRNRAKLDVACALTTQGNDLADLIAPALLHYSLECKRLGVTPGANNDTTRFSALAAWEILHKIGHFPTGTAPTLRMFIYDGQRTVEELVDRYRITNPDVRLLLVDYLTRRRAGRVVRRSGGVVLGP